MNVNKHKIILHSLSPGCESCIRGDWFCCYLTPNCNLNCFYCMNQFDVADQHFPKTPENITLDLDSYLKYLKRFEFKGVGFSGGEPLLEFERLLQYIRITRKEFGNQHYMWLYTNGTLVTVEKLKTLRKIGLDEIRFDIAADEYRLDPVGLATEYIDSVAIEIPAIPDDADRLKNMLPQLESLGVKHLNLHQLVVNARNRSKMIDRCCVCEREGDDHNTFPIEESRVAALDILHYGENVLSKMGINYCSYEYKMKYQRIANWKRWSMVCREEMDSITRSGLMRSFSIDGIAVNSIEDALNIGKFPKTVVAYYKPELHKVSRDDEGYSTCEIQGRYYGYTFRRKLLYECVLGSEVELFIYYNLFELRLPLIIAFLGHKLKTIVIAVSNLKLKAGLFQC